MKKDRIDMETKNTNQVREDMSFSEKELERAQELNRVLTKSIMDILINNVNLKENTALAMYVLHGVTSNILINVLNLISKSSNHSVEAVFGNMISDTIIIAHKADLIKTNVKVSETFQVDVKN